MKTKTKLAFQGLVAVLIAASGSAFASDAQQAIRQQIDQPLVLQAQYRPDPDVEAFYRARHFMPAWQNPVLIQALDQQVGDLRADGLGKVSLVQPLPPGYEATGNMLASRDIYTTEAMFDRLHGLRYGQVAEGDMPSVFADQPMPARAITHRDPVALLNLEQGTGALNYTVDRVRPASPLYRALMTAYADYQKLDDEGGWPTIPATDEPLKPGERDPAVKLLRKRMAMAGAPVNMTDEPDYYDSQLAAAVKQFQSDQYLDADGVVGDKTREALNVSVQERVGQIRVNMERARWLMQDLPKDYVLVDIAGYKLSLYENGKLAWRTNVIVGKPYKKTPSLRSEIQRVEFNPPWNIPESIVSTEIRRRVANDPSYLANRHMELVSSDGEALSPDQVDWSHPADFRVRQQPGPGNSLGQVIIRFPNDYAVYLHDTPAKSLFGAERRAMSHGCVRVENVRELARLLINDPSWDQQRIDQTIASGQTTNVAVKHQIPVLIHYWTVDVSGDHVAFKPDIYHRDNTLLQALNDARPVFDAPTTAVASSGAAVNG